MGREMRAKDGTPKGLIGEVKVSLKDLLRVCMPMASHTYACHVHTCIHAYR